MAMGKRGIKENTSLEILLLKIDLKKFPYQISPTNMCLYFFDGKFKASPEALFDVWSYHKLNPNLMLAVAQKYLHLLTPDEEIDFTFKLEERIKGGLITLEVCLLATVFKSSKHPPDSRILLSHTVQGPDSLFEEDSWDVLLTK